MLKNITFFYEHKVYILKDFKFLFEKINHSSSIYIVNFERD
jgi:hypothetical protein